MWAPVKFGKCSKTLGSSAPAEPAAGVNGVKICGGALLWTNTNAETFNRIPIHPDGTAAGVGSTFASGIAGDDFVFNKRGDAFIAQNSKNDLVFLDSRGGSELIIAGNPDSTALAGPSACQLGRMSFDMNSLYVTTDGGIAGYFTGNFTVGGTDRYWESWSLNGLEICLM